MSFGSSKQSSKPVDMTPQAFKNLQGPFADTLAKMLGYDAVTTPGTPASQKYGITGYTQERDTAGSTDHAVYRQRPVYGMISTPGTAGSSSYTARPGTFAATGNPNDLLAMLPKYDGPLSAPLGANENEVLQMLMEKQRAGPNGPNPLLDEYIRASQRPTLQALTETLTRDLPGRFTEAGQFIQPRGSSAFDRAAAIATRGAADANADIATKIGYQAFENSGTRFAQEIDTTIKNLQAQALPRLIQEMGIERGIEQFNSRVETLMKTLGITAGVTQPTIANNSSGKSTQLGIK